MDYFSGGFIDYEKNDVVLSHKLYDSLNEVKFDLNEKIGFVIYTRMDVRINDEFMYILNYKKEPENTLQFINDNVLEQEMTVDNNLSLIFRKNGFIIDIYKKVNNKGYIFTNSKLTHTFKFFINPLNTSINEVDPFKLTETVKNDDHSEGENNDSFDFEEPVYICTNNDRISDPFLDELKERLQKIKIKME